MTVDPVPLGYMLPNASFADQQDQVRVNAKLACNHWPALTRSPYLSDLFLGQFRAVVGAATINAPVTKFVCLVHQGVAVIEVLRTVVLRVAVLVANHWSTLWRLSNKCGGDQAVYPVMSGFAVNAKRDFKVPAAAAPKRSQEPMVSCGPVIRDKSLHAPEARRGIGGRKRYRLPDFVGMVGVSHGAVPSRGGQGRATLDASFRSALHARFHFCSQAKGGLV